MSKQLFDSFNTKPLDIPPVNVTAQCLGKILGVSAKRVANMVSENKLTPVAHNSYDLIKSVRFYLDSLRSRHSGKKDALEDAKLEKIQRENAIAGDLLIDTHLAAHIVMGLASLVVNQLEGLAPRVAADLAEESDPGKVQGVLYEECRRIMETISTEIENSKFIGSIYRDSDPAEKKDSLRVGG